MNELLENSGQSDPTSRGGDKNLIPRDELNKVVAQRDRFKEEARTLKIKHGETEETRKQLSSRLDQELQDKNLAESKKQDLENRLAGVEERYSSEKTRLEDGLKQAQMSLDEAQKKINAFLKEKTLTEEENVFIETAKRAAFSARNAELLFGYLRSKNRLRSAPVYGDTEKMEIKGYRQEIECLVPDGTGKNLERRYLPLGEAMPYLKQENKELAPAQAPGGGQGSIGSDGFSRPGFLNKKTMTVEEYIAARDPRTGKVFVTR